MAMERTGEPWTAEEDAYLRKTWRDIEISTLTMSRELKRTIAGIQARAQTLGIRDERQKALNQRIAARQTALAQQHNSRAKGVKA